MPPDTLTAPLEVEGVEFREGARPHGVDAVPLEGGHGWEVTLPSGRVVQWRTGLGSTTSQAARWRLVEPPTVGKAAEPPPPTPERLLSAAELVAIPLRRRTPAQQRRFDLLVDLGEIVVRSPEPPERPPFESTSQRRMRALERLHQDEEYVASGQAWAERRRDERTKARL